MKKRKIYLFSGIGTVMVLAASVTVWSYQTSALENVETVYKETTVERGNLTVGVTESGSVKVGTLTQEVEFAEGTASSSSGNQQTEGNAAGSGSTASNSALGTSQALEVEEVFVSAGQSVSAGEPLLKLTEESVAAYRKELTDAVNEASAAVSEAKLNAARQKLEAGYSYHLSVAEGSVAQEEYDAEMESLSEAVDEAQKAVDESAALLNYYQEQIDAGVDLSASLEKEQKNYNTLNTRLKSAQNSYTTKSIEAEKSRAGALLSSENADSQYQVDVAGADSSIETAQEELDEANEAREEFETFIDGEGILYCEYTGTVMEVLYAAGDELSAGTSAAVFADEDAVTMTVSVSQEDISGIAIGDAVNISLTAYENMIFEGEVQSMDTSVSSGSSTVSYDVTVLFAGDTAEVHVDMTGSVTFIKKQVENVLYVSNKAITKEGDISYVKVKETDGTIRKTEVITGFSDGVNAELSSGVSEGETVLIESQVKGN